MSVSRESQKFERVTVSLVPTADERSFENVPTTFSALHRSYEWRRASQLRYMIVPKRISSQQIVIELFVERQGKGAHASKDVARAVESFVQHKIASEWKGLKLGAISRPSVAAPPQRAFVRGTIEEMIGTKLLR
jgi:hypothetical protein